MKTKTSKAKKVIAGLGLAGAALFATVSVSTAASPVSPNASTNEVLCNYYNIIGCRNTQDDDYETGTEEEDAAFAILCNYHNIIGCRDTSFSIR